MVSQIFLQIMFDYKMEYAFNLYWLIILILDVSQAHLDLVDITQDKPLYFIFINKYQGRKMIKITIKLNEIEKSLINYRIFMSLDQYGYINLRILNI